MIRNKLPRITACVVSYNSADTLRDCLSALCAQSDVEVDVVVFDNNSQDESAEIALEFENVKVIRCETNIGFAAGANAAFAEVDSPFILFCNPDAIVKPGCLGACAQALINSDPAVAAAQPKLIRSVKDDKGRLFIDSTGMLLSLGDLSPHDRGRGEIDTGQYDGALSIFGPTAACALWRREALCDCLIDGELFDEDFFAYYEDVDLAWRAGNLGWRFLYVPRAVAVHDRKDPPYHGPAIDAGAFANRYLLLVKNADGREMATTLARTSIREAPRWILKSLTQPGFISAWRQLLRGLPKMIKKRKRISQARCNTKHNSA